LRARRKAENAAKTVESRPADQPPGPETPAAAAADSSPNISSPPIEREATQDSSDWLLDSPLGRWLGSSRLAFTNITVLKVLLWLVLLGLFAELDFGLPFFLISLFYWMYEGLRSPAARQPGELSAYSVFNPDCQPLLGAITAEQLEGEMGYRPLAANR
ncbi:hypothetical protein CRUP_023682, partial [Coryphaenoides rupestris]